MPARKEDPQVEAKHEATFYGYPFYWERLAAKVILGLAAIFIGFSILVAAFGTGFAAGRFTAGGKDGRYGMMGRGNYCQQYEKGGFGPGMMNRDGKRFRNGPGQGLGQRPVYPDPQSSGSGSEELPPSNAPAIP